MLGDPKMVKAPLLMCGSVLEGILLDVLDRNPALAGSWMAKRKWPDDASLPDLIQIASEQQIPHGSGKVLLDMTAKGTAEAIADHRDLIHPRAEVRAGLTLYDASVDAMVVLLRLVIEGLGHAAKEGLIDEYQKL
jgi:hypothetical protein